MAETSLLAQLFPYFKGSQEDVATTSLQYIVSENEVLNRAFTSMIMDKLCTEVKGRFQYRCQVSGKSSEKERPDISGYDELGNEKVLCESKFYAALTSNQPNTYLKRLIEENGVGLIFICPKLRIVGLWTEIIERVKTVYNINEINEECIEVQGVRLGIITWTEIIEKLSDVALNHNIDLMDIKQLRGYCEKLDSESFIPFDDLDFSIENAIKMERHVWLLDEVVTALKKEKELHVSTAHMNATPQRTGYSRYFKMKDFNISLIMDTAKWKNPSSSPTPYWLKISKQIEGKWQLDEQCKKALLRIPEIEKDGDYIAIKAPCYVALDEVVRSVKEQIIRYLELFETTK